MIWRIASVPFLLGDLDVKHGIPKIWMNLASPSSQVGVKGATADRRVHPSTVQPPRISATTRDDKKNHILELLRITIRISFIYKIST